MLNLRRLVLGLLLVAVVGGTIAYRQVAGAPSPVFLLDGVAVRSGVRDVPPRPALVVDFGNGSGTPVARVDGRPVVLRSVSGRSARLQPPTLTQGAWHRVEVWRSTWPWGRVSAGAFEFRTVDPLQVYVAWLATPTSVRADIGGSDPLDPAPGLEAEVRRAGAAPTVGAGVVTARWGSVRPGQTITLTVPAGVGGDGGAFLQRAFTASVVVPTGAPVARVQTSADQPVDTRGLRLQAYYVPTSAGLADLTQHARQIAVLSPTFYAVGADGSLVPRVDDRALQVAHAAGIQVEPLVINQGFEQGAAHTVMIDPAAPAKVAGELLAEAHQRGYAGYQLDFENLAAGDRDALSAFSDELGRRLRGAGLTYSVAVIPRKQDIQGLPGLVPSGASAPYAYLPLSRNTDWLSLMAYDQHVSVDDPGPVAGLDWARATVQYTSTDLNRAHVYLGVPFYFRDWGVDQPASVGSYAGAVQAAVDHGAGVSWDFAAATAYIRYQDQGVQHVLWFEEMNSLSRHVALAKELGVAGVSTWRLGFEDPGFWDLWPAR